MSAVRSIIDEWDSPAEFGRDLGLRQVNHAHIMKMRMSIPSAWWPKVVDAAAGRGYPVTFKRLAEAHVADEPLREAARRARKARLNTSEAA